MPKNHDIVFPRAASVGRKANAHAIEYGKAPAEVLGNALCLATGKLPHGDEHAVGVQRTLDRLLEFGAASRVQDGEKKARVPATRGQIEMVRGFIATAAQRMSAVVGVWDVPNPKGTKGATLRHTWEPSLDSDAELAANTYRSLGLASQNSAGALADAGVKTLKTLADIEALYGQYQPNPETSRALAAEILGRSAIAFSNPEASLYPRLQPIGGING